jgi:hypothetical protein
VNDNVTVPGFVVPSNHVMVPPLTTPEGPDTNDTVEGINPAGNTSITVTDDASLPDTFNVRSYRTTSPALGELGDPVFARLITAIGVGV